MYVLILFAGFLTGNPDQPLKPITRPDIGYYQTEELCKADGVAQLKRFIAGLPTEPEVLAAKCVKITGPEGTPA